MPGMCITTTYCYIYNYVVCVFCRFERLFKLHSICTDETMKNKLVTQMLNLNNEEQSSFNDCAATVFNTVDLTTKDSDSEEEEEALSAEAEVVPEAEIVTDRVQTINTDILEAVYEQSGYVIIPKVSTCIDCK